MLTKNKKGISEIVVTVIIILLAVVIFAVVSVVVRGTVAKGAENIELSSNCLEVEMHAVKIVPVYEEGQPSALIGYNVTVSRSATGKALDGVKLIVEDFANEEDRVSSENIIEKIKPLDKKIYTVFSGVNFVPTQVKVTVAPFFMKKSGEVFYCDNPLTDALSVE